MSDDRGHWEGDVFVCAEPVRIAVEGGDPMVIERIDFSVITLPEGVTRDEVLEAMLNPTGPAYPVDEHGEPMYRPDPYAKMTDVELSAAIPGAPTMRWFGESWGAPVCTYAPHVRTPVGDTCEGCGKAVEQGDQGVVIPRLGEGLAASAFDAVHLECLAQSALGERCDG